MFSVAIAACIVEGQRFVSAMRRCAHLTSDDRWPAFGLQAIFVISLIVVVGGFDLVFAFAGAVQIWIVNLGFMMFADIWSRIVAVSYHDLRFLKDGVGTEEIGCVFD